jgi:hypothetical protein
VHRHPLLHWDPRLIELLSHDLSILPAPLDTSIRVLVKIGEVREKLAVRLGDIVRRSKRSKALRKRPQSSGMKFVLMRLEGVRGYPASEREIGRNAP